MLENKADADFKLFAKVSDSVAKHCKFTLCCQLKSSWKQEFLKNHPVFLMQILKGSGKQMYIFNPHFGGCIPQPCFRNASCLGPCCLIKWTESAAILGLRLLGQRAKGQVRPCQWKGKQPPPPSDTESPPDLFLHPGQFQECGPLPNCSQVLITVSRDPSAHEKDLPN